VYALKTANGEFKRDSRGKIQYDEVLIDRHFLEAIRQAGEVRGRRYFAGNDFLSGAYAEYAEHIESARGESREQRYLEKIKLFPSELFCEALQG